MYAPILNWQTTGERSSYLHYLGCLTSSHSFLTTFTQFYYHIHQRCSYILHQVLRSLIKGNRETSKLSLRRLAHCVIYLFEAKFFLEPVCFVLNESEKYTAMAVTYFQCALFGIFLI
jgi:hypothetical protein